MFWNSDEKIITPAERYRPPYVPDHMLSYGALQSEAHHSGQGAVMVVGDLILNYSRSGRDVTLSWCEDQTEILLGWRQEKVSLRLINRATCLDLTPLGEPDKFNRAWKSFSPIFAKIDAWVQDEQQRIDEQNRQYEQDKIDLFESLFPEDISKDAANHLTGNNPRLRELAEQVIGDKDENEAV